MPTPPQRSHCDTHPPVHSTAPMPAAICRPTCRPRHRWGLFRATVTRSGFTLLELMIVVAIIAIIAAIAFPSLQNARKSGNEAAAVSMVRSLVSAAESFRTRFGVYPQDATALALEEYIDFSLLVGPSIQKSGYQCNVVAEPPTFQAFAVDCFPLSRRVTGDLVFAYTTIPFPGLPVGVLLVSRDEGVTFQPLDS